MKIRSAAAVTIQCQFRLVAAQNKVAQLRAQGTQGQSFVPRNVKRHQPRKEHWRTVLLRKEQQLDEQRRLEERLRLEAIAAVGSPRQPNTSQRKVSIKKRPITEWKATIFEVVVALLFTIAAIFYVNPTGLTLSSFLSKFSLDELSGDALRSYMQSPVSLLYSLLIVSSFYMVARFDLSGMKPCVE